MSEQNRYRGSESQSAHSEPRGSWRRDDEASLLDRGNYAPRRDAASRPGEGEWQRDYGQRPQRFEQPNPDYPRSYEYPVGNEYPFDRGFAADDRYPRDDGFTPHTRPGVRSYSSDRDYYFHENRGPAAPQHRSTPNSIANFGSRTRAEAGYYSGAQAQGFYGRGPKGYARSDERIREDVCERLSENDEVDASDIEVTVKDHEVTLSGAVETRRMKHIAEDLAASILGVEDVHNRITVRKAFLKDVAHKILGDEPVRHHANGGTKTSAEPINGRS